MNPLKIYPTVDQVIEALAEHVCNLAKAAIDDHGTFNFVLSGGNSPRRLYELLASDTFRSKVDWEKVRFFFGDERFVPEEDSRKNFNMVKDTLFRPLNISKDHIFEVDTSETAEIAAQKYNAALRDYFGNQKIAFDFTLLGLGDNSHTASLFPHTSVLDNKKAEVQSLYIDEVGMNRITMTAPLINQSRNLAFLVFGKGKSEAVFHILEDKTGSFHEHPARLIQPEQGEIFWFMDHEAASLLNK